MFGKELKMGPESKDVVVGVYIVSVVVVEYQVAYTVVTIGLGPETTQSQIHNPQPSP